MKNYKIKYFFNGRGEVTIKAKSREEAEEMFFDGEFEAEKEVGEDFQIDNIKEITKK